MKEASSPIVSRVQLGPLHVSFQGTAHLSELVREEVSSLGPAVGDADDVSFQFVDSIGIPRGSVRAGRWYLAEGVVVGDGPGFRYRLTPRPGSGFDVEIAAHRRRRELLDPLVRLIDWNFLSSRETVAKNFMYELFDVVTAVALLQEGASYLHASTCARDGVGIAMLAWGGVGKTTSIMKLITEDGWRYLSDDLGLVDSMGTIWRTPKHLQVYAYNVEGEKGLAKRLMKGRGPFDRTNWAVRKAIRGRSKVRRRISATALFGPHAVEDSAPLQKAIFLERADVPHIENVEIDLETLAHRCATILVDELGTLFELAIAAESHGVDTGVPTSVELRAGFAQVVGRALSEVSLEHLRIPFDAGPNVLAEGLRSRL